MECILFFFSLYFYSLQSMQNIFLVFTPLLSGLIAQHFGMAAFLSFLISIVSCI